MRGYHHTSGGTFGSWYQHHHHQKLEPKAPMLSPQQLMISATSSALGFLLQQAFMGNQQFFQFTNDDFTLHVPLESLCRQFIGLSCL
ncbi:hypothetical protein V6Z12_D02G272000 [Gossypium hirsutum]|uniref:Uncharacterized protein n=1 Tax=Gossypium tomentosum TaxID=34277 RepID=A0A5D2M325_GOSTO|nr:hypothetical protein ES332_D02G287700v1 [Gossypium tomentosum]